MNKFPKNATIVVRGSTSHSTELVDFMRTLYATVAEKPKYVYERPVGSMCMYVNPYTRKPSCLFGHVFVALGIPTTEGRGAASLLRAGNKPLPVWVGISSSGAQRVQDGGGTWGNAWREFVLLAAAYGVKIEVEERSITGVEVMFA